MFELVRPLSDKTSAIDSRNTKMLKSFSSLEEYFSAENKTFKIVIIRCKHHCMQVQRALCE
jgi:hypothetical protein